MGAVNADYSRMAWDAIAGLKGVNFSAATFYARQLEANPSAAKDIYFKISREYPELTSADAAGALQRNPAVQLQGGVPLITVAAARFERGVVETAASFGGERGPFVMNATPFVRDVLGEASQS